MALWKIKVLRLLLNYRNSVGNGDLRYNISANLSHYNNKITALIPGVNEQINGRTINRVGHPINSYYLIESDGIIQNQGELDAAVTINDTHGIGDLRFVDQNGDGEINGDDRVLQDKGLNPDFTYGFNFGLNYKGLKLNVFMQGVEGLAFYANHNLAQPFFNGAGVTKEWVANAWTPENPNTSFPRLYTSFGNSPNKTASTFHLKDADYLRVKNIQLSYTFPTSIVDKLGLGSLEVFINSENPITFTKLDGFDPERVLNQNITGFNYPSVFTFTSGINITF